MFLLKITKQAQVLLYSLFTENLFRIFTVAHYITSFDIKPCAKHIHPAYLNAHTNEI